MKGLTAKIKTENGWSWILLRDIKEGDTFRLFSNGEWIAGTFIMTENGGEFLNGFA